MSIELLNNVKAKLNNKRITSLKEFKSLLWPDIQGLKNFSGLEYFEFFRGQALDTYKLESGLARETKDPSIMQQIDEELQSKFVSDYYKDNIQKLEDSVKKNISPNFVKEWKLYFQSQHLGLKTRLLDWTINWRIGLMFALGKEKDFGKDGQLWIFFCPKKWRYGPSIEDEYYSVSPFSIEIPYMINMAFLYNKNWSFQTGLLRAARQNGRLFILPYDKAITPMEKTEEINKFLVKLIIDGDSKEQIQKDLFDEENIDFDWAMYRQEEKVDDILNEINTEVITKYRNL